MFKVKRYHLFSLLLSAVSFVCGAAGTMRSAMQWDIVEARLAVDTAGVRLSMEIDMKNDAVAKKCAVVLQPYVMVRGVRTDLRPVACYRLDARGERYVVRSDTPYASGRADEASLVCGLSAGRFRHDSACPGVARGDTVVLYMETVEWRKTDRRTVTERRRLAEFVPEAMPEFYPDFFQVYVDEKEYRPLYTVTFPLRVSFDPKKNTTFNVSYEDNESAVYDFCEGLKGILLSSQTRVTAITLKAYSGIDGPSQENFNVARSRLSSVYSYLVKQNAFSRRSVTQRVVGEDWDGVRDWVKDTYWVNDAGVMRIIMDDDMPKDVRERRLRDIPAFWEDVDRHVLPGMERFECVVDYTLLPYRDDDARWLAFNEGRGLLSQYDYSCLMRSMNLWSAGWYDVVFDFVERYPLCRQALVDAFGAALSLGHLNEASKYVRYASSDDDMIYYKAVWLMFMGDVDGSLKAVRSIRSDDAKYENTRRQIEAIYDWGHSGSPWTERVFTLAGAGD